MRLDLSLPELVGQLIVGGFEGEAPTPRFAAALAKGHRGGAILFRRNLPSIDVAAELCAAICDAAPRELPPFVGVDQEGGRVTRLPSPMTKLPAMRELVRAGDASFVEGAGRAVAVELAAIGFNLNFAPILDVDTNPANPIIGDRAFGTTPEAVSELALAFARGLAAGGVLACGKHFPGHGDTDVDSHLDLPVVRHDRARLEAVELAPFRAAAAAALPTLMTAHVVCEALDPGVPATLSRKICTTLLRDVVGYRGVLFSDDLEMKALADRMGYAESAVRAIDAGCDVVLVCKDEDAQDAAHEALVRHAERDAFFRARCEQAAMRGLEARRACPPRPLRAKAARDAVVGGPLGRAVLERVRAAREASR